MKLVQRFDDPRPKNLKIIGRTRKSLQTDGRTMPYHNMSHVRQVKKKKKNHSIMTFLSILSLPIIVERIPYKIKLQLTIQWYMNSV